MDQETQQKRRLAIVKTQGQTRPHTHTQREEGRKYKGTVVLGLDHACLPDPLFISTATVATLQKTTRI